MKTHDKIIEAIKSLASIEPLSVSIPFRGGYNAVFMDGFNIRAYKVGNCNPLVIQWEDLTPTEALRLKRICCYTLERQLLELNEKLSAYRAIEDEFSSTPFGNVKWRI